MAEYISIYGYRAVCPTCIGWPKGILSSQSWLWHLKWPNTQIATQYETERTRGPHWPVSKHPNPATTQCNMVDAKMMETLPHLSQTKQACEWDLQGSQRMGVKNCPVTPGRPTHEPRPLSGRTRDRPAPTTFTGPARTGSVSHYFPTSAHSSWTWPTSIRRSRLSSNPREKILFH